MDPREIPAAAVLDQSVDTRAGRDDIALAPGPDELLAARLAKAPGLVRAGGWRQVFGPVTSRCCSIPLPMGAWLYWPRVLRS